MCVLLHLLHAMDALSPACSSLVASLVPACMRLLPSCAPSSLQLRAGRYKSIQDWRADIQLIWDNARKYNGENHPVSSQAAKLEAAVDRRMEDAIEIAKANLSAEARGEPRPRKQNSTKPPRSADLGALLSSQLRSSDSDSMDEPGAVQRVSPSCVGGGAAAAVLCASWRACVRTLSSSAPQRSPHAGCSLQRLSELPANPWLLLFLRAAVS